MILWLQMATLLPDLDGAGEFVAVIGKQIGKRRGSRYERRQADEGFLF